jgi:hypothetical protein
MSALAEAVHRGRDGSVHYLASSPTGSQLIITDPVLGVRRQSFDGPCVLVSNTGSVEYRSISRTESITVWVRPGQEPSIHSIIGVCAECMAGDHDFEHWPHCPGSDREPKADVLPLQPRSEPVAEPVVEPAPCSSTGTGDAQAAPRVRVLDPQYTPPSEEPVAPPEMRWGGPAGGW